MNVIELCGAVAAVESARLRESVSLAVCSGEQLAIVGDNSSGKTCLAEMLASQSRVVGQTINYNFSPSTKPLVSDNLKYITFKDSYGLSSDQAYYMQQRWTSLEIDPDTPSVGEKLQRSAAVCAYPERAAARLEELVELFSMKDLMDKYLITLSSGELRKYQLTRALIAEPKVLIMDNPYIGLDPATRSQLTRLFEKIISDAGITVILVLSRPEEIPSFITHVVEVKDMVAMPKQTREDYFKTHFPPEVLRFNNVSIRYGERTILQDLDWVVRRGEHWVLTGSNGCGKSTLLSLVCADNPQAYACDIELFGRKRGTGESIWEIKKHIGYVSPEMHRSFTRDMLALDVVCSGHFDTIGLGRRPSEEQKAISFNWMKRFGIESLAGRHFKQLSSAEQRLCLVARAFVKNPELLILDEPMHGLDEPNRLKVKRVIEEYCSDPSKTLVMVSHFHEDFPSCIDRSLVLTRH